ncbi:uncharacterized protein RSE6_11856 [Rhynchosporium secalis]|uniref:Uncharacterized protein n=1 Tax=Rhynchosporium secalis TaxID=38038 RepID=A0A1E1MNZ1_RHYSE|nr:uncharacterized protein RSE6_11856 [Rhynchosporium secalis]
MAPTGLHRSGILSSAPIPISTPLLAPQVRNSGYANHDNRSYSRHLLGLVIYRTGNYLSLIYAGVIMMTIGNGYIFSSPWTLWARASDYNQIIAGIGAGLLFQVPLIAIQASVHQDDMATGTATVGVIGTLVTASSVVIGGVMFQSSMDMKVPSLAEAANEPTEEHYGFTVQQRRRSDYFTGERNAR